MAVYKTKDLLVRFYELICDGYEYVELSEDESDNGSPCLSPEVLDDGAPYFYPDIVSCDNSASDFHFDTNYSSIDPNSLCGAMMFTYNEIFTIHHAVNNALEYFKECEKDPSYSREVRDSIKRSSVSCRNLQAKLNKFIHSRFNF